MGKGVHVFFKDEKIVYPGHGVARISRIVEKKIGNETVKFYELAFLHKDMTILIPMKTISQAGIRRLTSVQNIKKMLQSLAFSEKKDIKDLTPINWGKRNKEYHVRLRSGDLQEIGNVYQELLSIAQHKELSFGEKKFLKQTEALLAQEISIVNKLEEGKAVEYLREVFKRSLNKPIASHV